MAAETAKMEEGLLNEKVLSCHAADALHSLELELFTDLHKELLDLAQIPYSVGSGTCRRRDGGSAEGVSDGVGNDEPMWWGWRYFGAADAVGELALTDGNGRIAAAVHRALLLGDGEPGSAPPLPSTAAALVSGEQEATASPLCGGPTIVERSVGLMRQNIATRLLPLLVQSRMNRVVAGSSAPLAEKSNQFADERWREGTCAPSDVPAGVAEGLVDTTAPLRPADTCSPAFWQPSTASLLRLLTYLTHQCGGNVLGYLYAYDSGVIEDLNGGNDGPRTTTCNAAGTRGAPRRGAVSQTALHLAAEEGNAALCAWLLNEVPAFEEEQNQLWHADASTRAPARAQPSAATVAGYLNARHIVNTKEEDWVEGVPDTSGRTALMYVCRSGTIATLFALLKGAHSACISRPSWRGALAAGGSGDTIMMAFASRPTDHWLDVNAVDTLQGCTALHEAALQGKVDYMHALLAGCVGTLGGSTVVTIPPASAGIPDVQGYTALHRYVRAEVAWRFADAADEEEEDEAAHQSKPAPYDAASHKEPRRGGVQHSTAAAATTSLLEAAIRPYWARREATVAEANPPAADNAATVSATKPNGTVLARSSEWVFVEGGAGLNARNHLGQTPLHLAVQHGNIGAVRALLRGVSQRRRATKMGGGEGAHMRMEMDTTDTLCSLCKDSGYVTRTQRQAGSGGKTETLLLAAPPDSVSSAAPAPHCTTPCPTAPLPLTSPSVVVNCPRCVCDVNALDAKGLTPLQYACVGRYPDVALVSSLLAHGASVNGGLWGVVQSYGVDGVDAVPEGLGTATAIVMEAAGKPYPPATAPPPPGLPTGAGAPRAEAARTPLQLAAKYVQTRIPTGVAIATTASRAAGAQVASPPPPTVFALLMDAGGV